MKKLRILLIAWSVPYPTTVGGRQRTNLLHQALSELGEVDLVALHDPKRYREEDISVMRKDYGLVGMAPFTMPADFGFWRWLKPLAPRWMNRIAHNLNPARSFYAKDERLIATLGDALDYGKYDLIVGRYARSLAKLGLPRKGLPPVILDIDDLDSDAYESRLNQMGQRLFTKILLARHVKKLRKAQHQLFSQLDYLWVANSENLADTDLRSARVLPNIAFCAKGTPINEQPPQADCLNVMTLASFGYEPNVEAVDWFLNSVWRAVRKAVPNARFKIYGSEMSVENKARWSQVDGVDAIGFVEYVADAYRDCAFSVCPVLRGAGTNIKVIEAGMHHRACVVTEASARGFSCHPDIRPVLPIAKDAKELTAHVLELLQNHSKNCSFAKKFAEVVHRDFSYEGVREVVKDTVRAALSVK